MENEKLVNGKFYPLWSQFVDRKEEWIGGILQDFDNWFPDDRGNITTIKDITLKPNGEDSAFFSVIGEAFSCGFDVQYGGIPGGGEITWLTFSGYGGHTWRIKQKEGKC